jgi:cysteine desulfuration protein SufE
MLKPMSDFSSLNLEQIIDNFELFDDWEDKYTYLMDLGKKLPPLEAADRTDENKVHGCQAEVWVKTRFDEEHPPRMYLSGDSNSAIVKGLVALVVLIFSGKTSDRIVGTDEKEIFARLGLDQYLSPTRKVGLASMVEKIKALSRSGATT